MRMRTISSFQAGASRSFCGESEAGSAERQGMDSLPAKPIRRMKRQMWCWPAHLPILLSRVSPQEISHSWTMMKIIWVMIWSPLLRLFVISSSISARKA
ncbi:hypothetical protein D3C87_1714730 [compost metagenome]